jgi:hypothetical protein
MEWIDRVPLHHPAWMFILLFVMLGLLAWIRMYYGSQLFQLFQASANYQVAYRMFKDNSALQNQLDNILNGLYYLSFAYFIYMIELRFQWFPYTLSGLGLYAFNLLLVMLWNFSRILLLNLSGFFFESMGIFREYLYNSFIYNKIVGVVLLPVLIFVVYTRGMVQEAIFWICLAMLAGVVVMRAIRGFVFSSKKDVSIFYMFLYLCALELAPLILLYRWLEGVL